MSLNNSVPARKSYDASVKYLRRTVNYDDNLLDTAGKVPLGTLPAGAMVLGCIINVETAFDAGTTNVLTIGTADDDDAVLAAADVDETDASAQLSTTPAGYNPSSDTPLFVRYQQSGTAATAGVADICLWYADGDL